MKKCIIFLFTLLLTFGIVGSSEAFFMDFEEGLGNDGGNIVGVPGVSFTDSEGLPWMYGDATTGSWNVTSVDTSNSWGTGRYNMYGYVFAFLGITGDWGRIDFDDQDGTWFEVGVSSASNFWLEAYDASDTLIASAATGPCTQWEGYTDMVFLRVDAPAGQNIAYVRVHDEGNYWCVDQMSGDMAGGVPEPATMLLLGSGLIGLAAIGRKRFFTKGR